jgi:hypothetical protein
VYAPPFVDTSKVHTLAFDDDQDTVNASPETDDAFVCVNDEIEGFATGVAAGAVTVWVSVFTAAVDPLAPVQVRRPMCVPAATGA